MSGKRKGLSADDKRRVVLSVYHDKKEPFNLKEIETIASKLGVVQQTIKDVNQSLVDDFLVQSDKIGSANFFWSFPSKAYQDQITLKEQLQGSAKQATDSIAQLKSQIAQIQSSRGSKDRSSNLKKLEALKAQESSVNSSLELLKCNDPEEIKRVKKQLLYNLEQANRWTDNVWTVKSFLTKKKGLSGKDVDKMLGIDGTFDSLEDEESLYLPSAKKQKK